MIFRCQATPNPPLHDLHWRSSSKFGARWFETASSNRTWYFKYIFIQDGDLIWIPGWNDKVEAPLESFQIFEEELTCIHWFTDFP